MSKISGAGKRSPALRCPFLQGHLDILGSNFPRSIEMLCAFCPYMGNRKRNKIAESEDKPSLRAEPSTPRRLVPSPFAGQPANNEGAALSKKMLLCDGPLGQPPSCCDEDGIHAAGAGGVASHETQFRQALQALRDAGRYRRFRKIDRAVGEFPYAVADDTTRVVNWCGNDYLGMGQHPEVIAAAKQHSKGGTGVIGLPSSAHIRLQQEVADLHEKEAAMVFNSCYTANESIISAMVNAHPGCIVVSDSDNHASMIQGIRQSGAPRKLWRHNQLQHLEQLLSTIPHEIPKLVVFESVYSMDGTVAPIKRVLDICEAHGAMTFLDEVHAVGLYGSEGAGQAEQKGVMHRIDAVSGTFGKAYGVHGGYVAMPRELADKVTDWVSANAPYQQDLFMPPPIAASALRSVQILRGEQGRELRALHQYRARDLVRMLILRDVPVLPTETHIVPVIVGDARKCSEASELLLRDHKIYSQPINYPTVAQGTERLRFTPGPLHTPDMLSHLADAMADVWRRVNAR